MYRIYFVFLISSICLSCTKEQTVKREIKGTYDISELSVDYYVTGYDCQSTIGDFNYYKAGNPGKIKFSGKKTIQASYASDSHKSYIGYLDFEYDVTDLDGNKRSQEEEIIFQYEFVELINGDFDTIKINIITENNYKADLILEKEGNDIIAFKYQVFKNNCYTGYKRFVVK